MNSNGATHPVGQKQPNAWGLFDMRGNVWEWVEDWYDVGGYAKSRQLDPTGPGSGDWRVVRGGAWYNDDTDCFRCAYRIDLRPGYRGYDGRAFRCARTF
jgi:formylglycine-generating enzyme required for sulfatase activity